MTPGRPAHASLLRGFALAAVCAAASAGCGAFDTRTPVEGEGEEIPGGVAGDLYILLREEEHPLFERRGADLFAPLRIDLLKAVEGGVEEILGPDGESLSIRIEEGIQSGTVKVLEDRGLPVLGHRGMRGNLYLQVWVSTPAAATTKR